MPKLTVDTPLIESYGWNYCLELNNAVNRVIAETFKIATALARGDADAEKEASTRQEDAFRSILDRLYGVTKS